MPFHHEADNITAYWDGGKAMETAVIFEAVRTPIGKRGRLLASVHAVDLLATVFSELFLRVGISPACVDDVIVGCVDQVGEQSVNIARNAWLSAGLPESVPGATVDRQCGSSLQAIHFAAQGVMARSYDLVVAGGVESMSRVPMLSNMLSPGAPLTDNLSRRYRMDQGQWFDQALGAERVAEQWHLTRDELDWVGWQSNRRAAQAQSTGRFSSEIARVMLSGQNSVWAEKDEGIRADASLERMGQLPPAFPGLNLITAGNASQVSDGASAVLIGSRDVGERLGLRPRAEFVSFAVVGVNPVTMLTGPIPATAKALARAGLDADAIDLYEINEAFAPVVLAWQRETQVPWDKVNVNGGAIALGHPLGATGARLVTSMLYELERRAATYGLIAICEGGGMANATIIRRL